MKERFNYCALKPFALALEQLTEEWGDSYFMERAFTSLISTAEAFHLGFQFHAL